MHFCVFPPLTDCVCLRDARVRVHDNACVRLHARLCAHMGVFVWLAIVGRVCVRVQLHGSIRASPARLCEPASGAVAAPVWRFWLLVFVYAALAQLHLHCGRASPQAVHCANASSNSCSCRSSLLWALSPDCRGCLCNNGIP